MIINSIGPGGFHFKVPSHVLDEAMATEHLLKAGIALQHLLLRELRRSSRVGPVIGRLSVREAAEESAQASRHLQGTDLRGPVREADQPDGDYQACQWWFLTWGPPLSMDGHASYVDPS
jgi:hypothetical protein